jgi:hypothetical protein
MKKIGMLICMGFISLYTVFAQDDFRVAKWGDSKESIMKKEGKGNILDDKDTYVFYDVVNNMNCIVMYMFIDNKLVASSYRFKEEYINKNKFIEDYDELVSLLEQKYGEPLTNKRLWNNSLFKDDIESYGLAISIGHLEYMGVWKTNDTDFGVFLNGDNYKINLDIIYFSKKFQSLREQKRIKSKTEKL